MNTIQFGRIHTILGLDHLEPEEKGVFFDALATQLGYGKAAIKDLDGKPTDGDIYVALNPTVGAGQKQTKPSDAQQKAAQRVDIYPDTSNGNPASDETLQTKIQDWIKRHLPLVSTKLAYITREPQPTKEKPTNVFVGDTFKALAQKNTPQKPQAATTSVAPEIIAESAQ